jgi:hypothetical protein
MKGRYNKKFSLALNDLLLLNLHQQVGKINIKNLKYPFQAATVATNGNVRR